MKTEAKPATHTEEGNIEYWHCGGCDKYFSDEAGTKEITLEDTVVPNPTEHAADGSGWHFDETGHWAWVTDKEATADEAGLRHEECTVCGYEKAAVEIPATGTTEDPSQPPADTGTSGGDQSGNAASPKTGDDSNTALWIAALLAAAASMAGTAGYRRKRKSR